MKLLRTKATTLYETRLSRVWIARTAVCYLFAAIIWYILCVITPYMDSVGIPASDAPNLTRAAFTATDAEREKPDSDKPKAAFLPTGEQSFYLRLDMIERAKSSIDFMVYDIYEDVGAQYFFTALFRAADRGVKIRIVTDGKLGTFKPPYIPLQNIIYNHNNIEAYGFNGIDFGRPQGLMTLLHDKVLCVDGDALIVGGANMGHAAYLNNYDAEVLITDGGKSDVINDVRGYFDGMISDKLTSRRKRSKKVDEKAKTRYEHELEEYLKTCADRFGDARAVAQSVAVDRITHLTNPVTDGKKSPRIMQAMFELAESSERMTIVTPNALITDKKINRLRAAAVKNKSFRLITNSLYNSRNVAYAVYMQGRKKYLSDSIELWEYQADDQLHAKISVYDGRYTMIGSFNLDERSAHIDTESVLIIDSQAFAAAAERYIDEKIVAESCRVGMDNKYIPSDVEPGKVPRDKQIKYFFYTALAAVINLI